MPANLPIGYIPLWAYGRKYHLGKPTLDEMIKQYEQLVTQPNYDGPIITKIQYGKDNRYEAYKEDELTDYLEQMTGVFQDDESEGMEDTTGAGLLDEVFRVLKDGMEIAIFGAEPQEQDLRAYGPGLYTVEKRRGPIVLQCRSYRIENQEHPQAPAGGLGTLDQMILPLLLKNALQPAPAPMQLPGYATAPQMNFGEMLGLMKTVMDMQTESRRSAREEIMGLYQDAESTPTERIVENIIDVLGEYLPGIVPGLRPQIDAALESGDQDQISPLVAQIGAKLTGGSMDQSAVANISAAIADAMKNK